MNKHTLDIDKHIFLLLMKSKGQNFKMLLVMTEREKWQSNGDNRRSSYSQDKQ